MHNLFSSSGKLRKIFIFRQTQMQLEQCNKSHKYTILYFMWNKTYLNHSSQKYKIPSISKNNGFYSKHTPISLIIIFPMNLLLNLLGIIYLMFCIFAFIKSVFDFLCQPKINWLWENFH
jgi:hypothetical protein